MYPPALQSLIDLFAGLPEGERRELLIHYAGGSARHAPQPGEVYEVEDIRHHPGCTDTVGIHLRISDGDRCHFRVTLGPEVQTLTRAMSAILCEGLDGIPAAELPALSEAFVEKIVGASLVRLRSQTIYYVLNRMKEAAERWLSLRQS
ncbi:MAG TPA: Fe-S metabolism protein SufE [Verrucomicrobiales bacterium]|nr:Fe-S metabolism protein SufE [Verrucomicrobiales bacterium]